MIICETILFILLSLILLISSYTDMKENTIRNKYIVGFGILGLIVDFIYYVVFAKSFFYIFLCNAALLIVFSFVFYSYKFWAAGDSKLLALIGLLIPGRFYSCFDFGNVNSFIILLFTFCSAFIFVILESIYFGIKDKNLLDFSFGKIDFKSFFISYLFVLGTISLLQYLIYFWLGSYLYENIVLAAAIQFLLIIFILKIQSKFNTKEMVGVSIFIWGILLSFMFIKNEAFKIDFSSWGIVLIIIVFKSIAEKYNYQWIKTSDVIPGQILAATTILQFKKSRVNGLPTNGLEDLSARISEEEVESIKRWEFSKYGQPYILIVRKIPFALFISIGTILYCILGVVLR